MRSRMVRLARALRWDVRAVPLPGLEAAGLGLHEVHRVLRYGLRKDPPSPHPPINLHPRLRSASNLGPITLCLDHRSDYGLPRTSDLGPITLCLEPRSDYGLPRTSVRVRSASNPGPITVCLEPRSDDGVPRTPVSATMPDPKLQIQNAEFETQDPGSETSDSKCRV